MPALTYQESEKGIEAVERRTGEVNSQACQNIVHPDEVDVDFEKVGGINNHRSEIHL